MILYSDILEWIHTTIITPNPYVVVLMGGDLQATPHEKDHRSHLPALSTFCDNIDLKHITYNTTYTYIPASTPIDHWLPKQPPQSKHYNDKNTTTSTFTPQHGDHKALIIELP